MISVPRFVRSLCITLVFISFSNVSASAVDDSISELKEQIEQEKQSCINAKKNGFQDKKYSTKERLALTYLNNILDYLLEKNKIFLKSDQTFCITTVEKKYKDDHDGFHSAGNGLIRINITDNLFLNSSNYQDAIIAAIISHELAHEILKHRYQSFDIIVDLAQKFFEKFHKEANLDDPIFTVFLQIDESYRKAAKRNEIEADNLGFQLYAHSGFNLNTYKNHFLKGATINPSLLNALSLPEKIIRALINFSKNTQKHQYLIEAAEEAKKLEIFNEFMDSIQYIGSKDEHPTGWWRFLNIHEQQDQILKNQNIDPTTSNMFDTVYFKLDLHSIKRAKLKQIRTFFSKPDYFTHPILGSSDVRLFIIQSLFNNNPTVSISVLTDKSDRSDTGILQKDDTIIIRGNDLFRLALIMIAKEDCLENISDIEKKFNIKKINPEKLKLQFIHEMNNLQQKIFTPYSACVEKFNN